MLYITPYNHIHFILKSEILIAKEAIWSLNATKGGIETYPISDYIFHSLFLRLTGAQEQKLKCICWEMACRDYEYRYKRYERTPYSECSDYKDKCMVYKDILEEIKKIDKTFVITEAIKKEILNDWRTSIQELFENSVLVQSFHRKYIEYKEIVPNVRTDWIMGENQLFLKKDNIPESDRCATCGLTLYEIFTEYIYRERNRCAHNTKSYQQNLPTFAILESPEYKIQNYFLYISIIILLDNIYVTLFKFYLEKLERRH